MAQEYAAAATCFSCGRPWGNGCACQHCNQVYGFPAGVIMTSSGKRLGGYAFEIILCLCTLVIGWLIWSLIIYGRGQTPAKQLMGMRVVNVNTGVRAGWGRMFVREHLAKGLIGLISACAFYIPLAWLLWDKNRQQLYDKMLDTIVVDDPNGLVTNVPYGAAQYGAGQYLQQPQQQYQLPQGGAQVPWEQQQGAYGQQGDYAQPGYGQYGGYPPQPGGYGQQGGYPPQQGGYPPQPTGYDPQTGQPQYPPPPPPPPRNPPTR